MQALWGPCRRGWAWKVVTLEAVGWGRGGDPCRLAGWSWFRGAWACMHVCLTCVCVCAHTCLIITIYSEQLVLTKQVGLKRLSLFLLSNLCQY